MVGQGKLVCASPFPGAHADVGGGFSDGALKWRLDELTARGVRFSDNPDGGAQSAAGITVV